MGGVATVITPPTWQLEEPKPSWFLEREPKWYLEPRKPRIKRRGPIYRTALPAPELIEHSTAEGALDITFAVFGKWQEINSAFEGRFLERIQRRAFSKSIRENASRIRTVLSHGKDVSLGETVLGKIESIREEADRAVARVALFPSVPPLLVDGLRAGQYGASFRGDALQSDVNYRPGRSAYNPEGLTEVTRTEIRLKDIGPTAFAAYPETTATIGSAV